jgi:hypothetical protein
MAYDRQLIVQFLTGDPSDQVIKCSAKALNKKAKNHGLKSHLVSVPCGTGQLGGIKDYLIVRELKHELKKLTHLSRLYIQGHGSWQTQRVGNWSPEETANCLVNCGLPEVDLISILACEAGRDLGTANNARLDTSADSYASNFHAHLWTEHKLKIKVFARVFSVGLFNSNITYASPQDKASKFGTKYTFNEDGLIDGNDRKRAASKVLFDWVDGKQVRTIVAYP